MEADILIKAKPLIPYMARRRRGRGGGQNKFQVLKVNVTSALGTLGTATVADVELTALQDAKFKVISADLLLAIRDLTPGEGPIEIGIFNGDLSNTEVGEALDATPVSQSDIIPIERLKRPVRLAGIFSGQLAHETLNDGKRMRIKLRTILNNGTQLAVFMRNQGGAALTTGAVVNISGQIYGYWI